MKYTGLFLGRKAANRHQHTDPSMKYTGLLLGRKAANQHQYLFPMK